MRSKATHCGPIEGRGRLARHEAMLCHCRNCLQTDSRMEDFRGWAKRECYPYPESPVKRYVSGRGGTAIGLPTSETSLRIRDLPVTPR